MTATTPLRPADTRLSGAKTMVPSTLQTCAVRLIDRRTGAVHRVNGSPLTVYTRRPNEAAAELLQGRDPAVWEARIDPIGGTK